METANVLVSLGGDSGNTVPRMNVTAAEIAVLRAIHGNDSVTEIEPVDDIAISNREERARLQRIYGGATDGNQNSIVGLLFPGAAARVFETLDELDLPESFYKATGRMKAPSVSEPVAEDTDEVNTTTKKRAAKKSAPAPLPMAEEDDGIAEMPDAGAFK